MLTNLYIAYGITWAIHLGYLGYLVNRWRKAKSKP
jgi:hypothetical protein